MDPKEYRAKFAERMAQFERFHAWELANERELTPDETIRCVAELYEVLPREALPTEIDPSGIARMHRILAHMPKESQ